MKTTKLLPVIILISFAILVQNTCPYGFAAKTGFAAPKAHDCPFKKCHTAPSKEGSSPDENSGKALFPAFVLSMPEVQAAIHCFAVNREHFLFSSNNYKDPFKKPIIKPPAV
jgi:hypothetical protein